MKYLKYSLLDYPEKISAVVFFEGCNMRCWYCHNYQLLNEKFSEKEFEDIVKQIIKSWKKNEIDAVVITGGEPLLHAEVVAHLINNIRMRTDLLIKLDTNGSFPEQLEKILKMGVLDYVALDIKTSKEKYKDLTGLDCYDKVMKSVKLLRKYLRKDQYEFRTTLSGEFAEKDDLIDFIEQMQPLETLYLQQVNLYQGVLDRDKVVKKHATISEYVYIMDEFSKHHIRIKRRD